MQFYPAPLVNIVQSYQRDESFIEEIQDYLTSSVKCFGQRNYNRIRKLLPYLSTTWYYLLTSLSNLQTLGEEYAGIIRLNSSNKVPSKYLHILWLIFYLGGEPLLDRIISYWENQITKSIELRNEAKKQLTKNLRFIKANKDLLLRLHYSFFYINGKYYNVSNRTMGVKYVLLRQWMQNETASKCFQFLGVISLIYVMYSLMKNYMSQDTLSNENISYSGDDNKMCILCVEQRKNTCVTFCGHLFCWECIYDSLKYQQNCPVCREVIRPSRIVFLQNYA